LKNLQELAKLNSNNKINSIVQFKKLEMSSNENRKEERKIVRSYLDSTLLIQYIPRSILANNSPLLFNNQYKQKLDEYPSQM
jgi:hypothetical protein